MKKYLHAGLRQDVVFPNCSKMIQDAANFFPLVKKSKWQGSFFVTRCVKPNVEKTDERTSSLNFISDKLVTIHSGKLVSCVNIAEQLVNKL